MSKTKSLSEIETVVAVAEIQRFGDKLTLPEGMKLDTAIDLLQRRAEYEEEETAFSEAYDVFPYDGAHALNEVLIAMYGWAPATGTPTWFGTKPPTLKSVEVAPGVFKKVPWGRFSLPNITGYVETSVSVKNNRYVFSIEARIKRVNEEDVRKLFASVREYLKTGSIYQGKAIKIRFRDDNAKPLEMPQPKFLDTSKISREMLVYSDDVMNSVETNLFTPIERVKDLLANGIPVKRGVLLGGIYGTGKTMAATVASKLAVDTGVTYVYIPRADELADAIEFAKQYQSPACVIFCEDIDRVTAGERSVKMDDILNILDGIDTKGANIITVLTTNDMNSINPAMLRPGRLDAVIDVTPPDAKAAEKLLRLYGAEAVDPDTDLTAAGKELDGQIPAIIAEVMARAKLSQLRLQPEGEKVSKISEQAILEASKTMAAQIRVLKERSKPMEPAPALETSIAKIVVAQLEPLVRDIRDIKDHMDIE